VVTKDPFAPLPITVRLGAAAALCALTLGSPTVRAAPVRVFVVAAVLGLVVASLCPRTPGTRRLARAASAAIAVGLVLAMGARHSQVVLLLAFALALAGPPAWRSLCPRNRGVLASIHRDG
jgi:hypothetical protein